MKIRLDFENQIITVEDKVNLSELVSKLEKILPDYKEWKLDTNVTVEWNTPTYPSYPVDKPYWENPWWCEPYYTNPMTGHPVGTHEFQAMPTNGVSFLDLSNLEG